MQDAGGRAWRRRLQTVELFKREAAEWWLRDADLRRVGDPRGGGGND